MSAYVAAPADALALIDQHHGLLLIDLDETLYLRNSTEDFLDCATPRLVALLLLRLLDIIRPWRWSGGEPTRDVWRVRLVAACCPWMHRRWRTRVAALALAHTNRPLLEVLLARPPGAAGPVIATVGFMPVVTPLVAALGLPQADIVAARLDDGADRRSGKLALVHAALGEAAVAQALVLTDAAQDEPLLRACAVPLHVVWPQARCRAALGDVYLPGQYLSLVKRPGERYITRAILQEDFALWVLCSIALAAVPLAHLGGLALLLLSFWTIYERGYVDNDRVAARWEADPKLSAAYVAYVANDDPVVATPVWQPWLWAAAAGAAGVWLLRWPGVPAAADLLTWAGVLLATHAWFTLYNRFDKGTRVWLFIGLQFARSAAFVALVPVSEVGAAALGAHVLARWVPYYVYRIVGQAWPDAPFHLTRLLFFVVLSALLALSSGLPAVLNGTALALLAWGLYRARQELATVCAAARRLDHVVTEPAP